MIRTKILSSLLTLCLTASGLPATEPPMKIMKHNVKIISLSWNTPRADEYARRLPDLEKNCPADGLGIESDGKARIVNGRKFIPGTRTPMGKIAWKYEDFTDVIAALKKVKSKKFTHNFFYTIPCPGDIDWMSDSDWAAITNNYGLAARIAKEVGMKGILLDIEQYGEKFWTPKFKQSGKNFEEICTIARQRGQEWGKAVFSQYPDIVIFALTMFSSHNGYRMVQPFFNGVLDVMPPTAVFTDGHETEGYKANNVIEYDRMLRDKFRHFPKLVEPENRNKYFTQVRLAPAFYLDAIFLGRPASWSKILNLKPGADKLAFFQRNLFAAMRSGEDYIWLYGERACWGEGRVKNFFTRLETTEPGIYQMVENLRCPEKIDVSKLRNLLGAADFKSGLSPWKFWQIEENQKKVAWDKNRKGEKYAENDQKDMKLLGNASVQNGELRIQGTAFSETYQKVKVKPETIYLLRVQFRHDKNSHGACWIGMGYQDKNNIPLTRTDKSDTWWVNRSTNGEWVEMNRLIMIPPDVESASVRLGTGGMRDSDVISFRNVWFCELPPK